MHAQRQENARLREQNALLERQAQRKRPQPSGPDSDESEDEAISTATQVSIPALSEKVSKEVLRYGKHFAACGVMWVPEVVWDFVNEDTAPEEDIDEDDQAMALREWHQDVAKMIVDFLPKHLRKITDNELFISRVSCKLLL